MKEHLRWLWSEDRVHDAPRRVWRDWALIAVIIGGLIIEINVHTDMNWPIAGPILCLAVMGTLLFRRTHPLVATALAFASVVAFDIVAVAFGHPVNEVYTMVFVLLLPYSLFRWASGRHAAIGAAILVATTISVSITNYTGVGDIIGGFIVLLFPGAVGATVRFIKSDRLSKLDQGRLRERELLARELHDSVAHHVSAIAVQAQAGRVVAATNPDAAIEALAVIEEEASRTLADMRSIVSTLRTGDDAEFRPQQGLADIEHLARTSPTGTAVDVEFSGDIDSVTPTVQSAVFRLAQESITNAHRHARNASRINVHVATDHDSIRLLVDDDGERHQFGIGSSDGFGLLGMAERAKLLGGEFVAGPREQRGWRVSAVLPLSAGAPTGSKTP